MYESERERPQERSEGTEQGIKETDPAEGQEVESGGIPEGGRHWAGHLSRLKRALKRHTGQKLVYSGRDKNYYGHTRMTFNGKCPLHHDTNPSLVVYFDLVTGWLVPMCPVCGSKETGGEWIAKFCDTLGLGGSALKPPKEWIPVENKEEKIGSHLSPEDLEDRYNLLNRVYGHISHTTGLLPQHKADLIQRGLTEEQITRNGYFSIELVQHHIYGDYYEHKGMKHGTYIGESVAEVPGVPEAILATVPGFYWKSAKRKQKKREGDPPLPRAVIFKPAAEGIFIPFRDDRGRMIGGQIRLFKEAVTVEETQPDGTTVTKIKKPRKYIWPAKKKVGKWADMPGSSVHIPMVFQFRGGRLTITEGGLKADVATALGWPCIGVPGISTWGLALPLIERWKPIEVIIAFDMKSADEWESSYEKLHGDRFASELLQRGIRAMRTQWAFADSRKGIDDLLLAGGKPELVGIVDLQSQLRKSMPSSPLELWKILRANARMIIGTAIEKLFFGTDKSLLEK